MAKKEQSLSGIYEKATELLKRAQLLAKESRAGVNEAVFAPQAEYPSLPVAILLATDIHYGSIRTNYDLLSHHLDTVESTPNLYMISNGDEIDNFNAMFFSSGTFENPLPPQLQTIAILDRLKRLDEKRKIGVLSYGNHNEFMEDSGYSWIETFGRELPNTSIFPSGGLLHIVVGSQTYDMAIWHRYWGASKLNPTNANKRLMEHEYPQADIIFLGHTHQSEVLHFERGGKERIAVIGGTYKESDEWARRRGISGRSGRAGHVVFLWPNEHKMAAFKRFDAALSFMRAIEFEHKAKEGVVLYEREKKKKKK